MKSGKVLKSYMWWITLFGLCLSACDADRAADAKEGSASRWSRTPVPKCQFDQVVEEGGVKKLAVIVGVGEYAAPKVSDLAGPPNDARRFYEVLTRSTGKGGFGFHQQNVCLLLDRKATTQNFIDAVNDLLIAHADENDTAVIYFAGHGSQAVDVNGDEPDQLDETFMFHDSRVGGVRDLLDDDFHELLKRLYEKTKNIVTIVDSCNSGTSMRGDGAMVARFFEPDPSIASSAQASSNGDAGSGWAPDAMPGLVALTAASDGTAALEYGGRGVFTDALLDVFGRSGSNALTYAQLARQVPPLVAARSYQIPYFQGELSGYVFSSEDRVRPAAWEVTDTGGTLTLSGPPIPGMTKGATLRLYPGNASATTLLDPKQAIANALVESTDGISARARLIGKVSGKVARGDLALMTLPGDGATQLKLHLRANGRADGLPAQVARHLRDELENDDVYSTAIKLVNTGSDFELSQQNDGRFVLRGPENRIRNYFDEIDDVLVGVWRHARQKGLLNLRGEGGEDFSDNNSLQVSIKPADVQDSCAKGNWLQALPNQRQGIPLCYRWNIQVRLLSNSPVPLRIGGVIMSSDGHMFGLPADGRAVLLRPGETMTFNSSRETFRAVPPLEVVDQLLIFGTRETEPVAWHELSTVQRGESTSASGLQRQLQSYLQNKRGARVDEPVSASTWTMSALPIEVEANRGFSPASREGDIATREYTLSSFDIRPYLPTDPNSAMHKVLRKADQLARASMNDGFSYKQHAWDLASDVLNLKKGIDCSRAIWFAFTRSKLPYNDGDRYLPTVSMVAPNSAMSDQFDGCPIDAEPRLGDILVYRSEERGDGHVVMVIDPEKRIAWGSHGWDGAPRLSEFPIEPDTGVEYQRIKVKRDWMRWDRQDMQLKACWRYRGFGDDGVSGRNADTLVSNTKVCSPTQCRLGSGAL